MVVFVVVLLKGNCFRFLPLRFPINLDRNLVRGLGGGNAVAFTSCDRDRDEIVDGAVVPAESSLVEEASLIRLGSSLP